MLVRFVATAASRPSNDVFVKQCFFATGAQRETCANRTAIQPAAGGDEGLSPSDEVVFSGVAAATGAASLVAAPLLVSLDVLSDELVSDFDSASVFDSDDLDDAALFSARKSVT